MRLIFIGVLLLLHFMGKGQNKNEDISLLYDQVQSKQVEENQKEGVLFRLYKNVFSEQILNDCIYDHSCSHFSKDVFKQFGPLKGVMLTADRLTRCNRATFSQISDMLKNDEGRALDHWDYYVKKK